MPTLAAAVYLLCGATSFLCMVLLIRKYLQDRSRLLLWSALCFTGLAINNFLLFLDFVVLPDMDLRPLRTVTALISVGILLVGLIWETE
ncbi:MULTISPECIES: DUF5985 family protein [Nitrospirillum]|uniref:Uncharacterized protein n=1 Tax=Nitrospirillum amazonense TaxID=28077 RepID=A0A560FNB7_9PROT|nr:DUF5985 family protein [Nitrospirillum amazonense]MEC4592089.1 DUF5985 family protein [Nitrospirillum amazonense]TWB23106.1 hypothetical protein FBZ88_11429 [Nitrospirillum amazonense]